MIFIKYYTNSCKSALARLTNHRQQLHKEQRSKTHNSVTHNNERSIPVLNQAQIFSTLMGCFISGVINVTNCFPMHFNAGCLYLLYVDGKMGFNYRCTVFRACMNC